MSLPAMRRAELDSREPPAGQNWDWWEPPPRISWRLVKRRIARPRYGSSNRPCPGDVVERWPVKDWICNLP